MTLAWLYRINQRYGSSGVVPLLSAKRESKPYCMDNEPDEQLHFLYALYSRTFRVVAVQKVTPDTNRGLKDDKNRVILHFEFSHGYCG